MVAVLVGAGVCPGQAGKMVRYKTPGYVIYTDVDIAIVREVSAQLTAMLKMYQEETKAFEGKVRTRLRVTLYRSREDYRYAGGSKYFKACYRGKKLLTYLEKGRVDWSIVQCMGYFQYQDAVVPGKVPAWVSVGLAEYFALGIWTGDGFVTGVIPPGRLKRVKQTLSAYRMRPMSDMMSSRNFFDEDPAVRIRNYDQTWAMVHYLMHGEDGKYKKRFSAFLYGVSHGKNAEKMWTVCFGNDLSGFHRACWGWWAGLSPDPTPDKTVEATVQTLTSFLARAESMGQKFADVKEFFKTAWTEGGLKYQLPNALLTKALGDAEQLSEWSLQQGKKGSELVLKTKDGKVFRGKFELAGKKVVKVWTDREPEAGREK